MDRVGIIHPGNPKSQRLLLLLTGKHTLLTAVPGAAMVTVSICVAFELQFPCPVLSSDVSRSHDDPCRLQSMAYYFPSC